MSINLFGNTITPKEIRCRVYHDEREIPGKWLYHGFLFIPVDVEQDILDLIAEERTKSTWEGEIHFHGLRDTKTMNDLAIRWIRLFCCSLYRSTYFYLLGIDYANLAKDLWDNRRTRDSKIYNRFFQIGFYGAIKWFFLNRKAGFQEVFIEEIFSDAKNRMPEDTFRSQPISEIDFKAFVKGESIFFNCLEVIEVDSNHQAEKEHKNESHLIQYVDLLIGGFSQVLDNTSNHEGKCKVAETLVKYGLPKETMGYDHEHFKSQYYKRCAISFFPKTKLSKAELINKNILTGKDQFYNERSLLFLSKNQLSLFGDG